MCVLVQITYYLTAYIVYSKKCSKVMIVISEYYGIHSAAGVQILFFDNIMVTILQAVFRIIIGS